MFVVCVFGLVVVLFDGYFCMFFWALRVFLGFFFGLLGCSVLVCWIFLCFGFGSLFVFVFFLEWLFLFGLFCVSWCVGFGFLFFWFCLCLSFVLDWFVYWVCCSGLFVFCFVFGWGVCVLG